MKNRKFYFSSSKSFRVLNFDVNLSFSATRGPSSGNDVCNYIYYKRGEALTPALRKQLLTNRKPDFSIWQFACS